MHPYPTLIIARNLKALSIVENERFCVILLLKVEIILWKPL
jgi:hypothetical protein